MPATQVSRTDTFEQQRIKINQIGQEIFNVSQGGSDLTTGNLKLGDGSKNAPSLAFENDNSLGFFKQDLGVMSFASSTRKVFEYSSSQVSIFNDLFVIKNSLSTENITIREPGSGYGGGTYTLVPLTGGSGSLSESTIVVESFLGSVTNNGTGFTSGQYFNIPLTGGAGDIDSTTINFTVPTIEGSVSNGGSNYVENSYDDVSFTGGNGTGAQGTVVVDGTGVVVSVTITNSGSGYLNGDVISPDTATMLYLDENDATVSSTGSGATFVISNNPSSIDPSTLLFQAKGSGYNVDDILTLKPEVTGLSLTIVDSEGSPSSNIVISEAVKNQLVIGSLLTKTGGTGVLAANTTISGIEFDQDSGTWSINLSEQPTTAGSITVTSTPPYGNGSNFAYQISSLGSVSSVTVTNGGVGYAEGDVLSTNPSNLIQNITYTVGATEVQNLTFNPAIPSGALTTSDQVQVQGGVIEDTTLTVASTNGTPDSSVLGVQPISTSGNGVGGLFDISFDENGEVISVSISVGDAGYNYQTNDTVTFSGASLGATGNTTATISGVSSDGELVDVLEVVDTGSVITKITVASGGSFQETSRVKDGSNSYTLSSVEDGNKYNIDGNFLQSLTLYVGDTVQFSYPAGHPLGLSTFRDGIHPPSLIESVTGSVNAGSSIVTVNSSTGILEGMAVTSEGAGSIPSGVIVNSVDGPTQITISAPATATGNLTLNFSGTEYTDGVSRENNTLTVSITESTPTTLYYYCQIHPNMGGEDNQEAAITIDANNPRTFGSGLIIDVNAVASSNILLTDVANSSVTVPSLLTTSLTATNQNISGTLNVDTIIGETIQVSEIDSIAAQPDITVTAQGDLNLNATNFAINDNITIDVDGNIDSSGYFKTSSFAEFDEKIKIQGTGISSLPGFNVNITPADTQVVRIPSNTALTIPVGTTAQRPELLAESGSIRFNTESQQYEGYNANTAAWSSLGGVRDQDGNTFIKAEETVGANDNTLYFINDDVNTIKITPEFLQFESVKKISSANTTAPVFTNWVANAPVTTGAYLKFKNNLYEVIGDGTTGGPGSPPVDVSGNTFLNGSATLQFSQLAVGPVSFEDIEEVRIDPTGSSSLVINGDLRLQDNVISTNISDLTIRPNSGKKVVVDTNTTLVLPAGTDTQRGAPSQGSVRFNTSAQQFEGYDGTNWGSLGGVKDVDQNTYIIPELSPGSNENTLYFYNDNNNTIRISTTQLEFDTIDTIVSTSSDEFEITASLLTFDGAATTIDNTDTNISFIHTSKASLDLGLSSGLNIDPVLRLSDTGDIFYNLGFGTGVYNPVKIFDVELKEFELADVKILSEKINLIKGTVDTSDSIIYNNTLAAGSKTTVLAENTSTGDREFIEFGIIDNGTDVYHTEYGNLRTGGKIFVPTFSITPQNEIKITIVLDSSVGNTHSVNITIISNITKK